MRSLGLPWALLAIRFLISFSRVALNQSNTFQSGPTVASVTTDGFTLTFTPSSAGHYWAIVTTTADAGTATIASMKAGTNAMGVGSCQFANEVVVAGTLKTQRFNGCGLTPATTYKQHVYVEDGNSSDDGTLTTVDVVVPGQCETTYLKVAGRFQEYPAMPVGNALAPCPDASPHLIGSVSLTCASNGAKIQNVDNTCTKAIQGQCTKSLTMLGNQYVELPEMSVGQGLVECPAGFEGDIRVDCVTKGAAVKVIDATCRPAANCRAPHNVANSSFGSCLEGPNIASGTGCTPRCDTGYVPSTPTLACSDGSLNPDTYTCMEAWCIETTLSIAGNFHRFSAMRVGSDVVDCPDGSPGEVFLNCTKHGAEIQERDNSCTELVPGQCGKQFWKVGSEYATLEAMGPGEALVDCPSGFEGKIRVQCSSDGSRQVDADCQPAASCVAPANVTNAPYFSCSEGGEVSSGKTCTTLCDHGYVPSVQALSCSRGSLNPPTFTCSEGSCVATPLSVEGIFHQYLAMRIGNELQPCPEGLLGHVALKCTSDKARIEMTGHSCTAPVAGLCRKTFVKLKMGDQYLQLPAMMAPGQDLKDCPLGFEGHIEVRCFTKDAEVQVVDDNCKPAAGCEAPAGVGNASYVSCLEGPNITSGTGCTPRCDTGYIPSVDVLSCSDGNLKPNTFTCEEAWCIKTTLTIAGNLFAFEAMRVGKTIVDCPDGSPGKVVLTCTSDGAQIQVEDNSCAELVPGQCRKQFVKVGSKHVTLEAMTMEQGQDLVDCPSGFEGKIQVQCSSDGSRQVDVDCQPAVSCFALSTVTNAPYIWCLEGPEVNSGKACTTLCNTGYVPSVRTLSCSDGSFSPSTFSCIEAWCHATPLKVAGILKEFSAMRVGEELQPCPEGLPGSVKVKCVYDGGEIKVADHTCKQTPAPTVTPTYEPTQTTPTPTSAPPTLPPTQSSDEVNEFKVTIDGISYEQLISNTRLANAVETEIRKAVMREVGGQVAENSIRVEFSRGSVMVTIRILGPTTNQWTSSANLVDSIATRVRGISGISDVMTGSTIDVSPADPKEVLCGLGDYFRTSTSSCAACSGYARRRRSTDCTPCPIGQVHKSGSDDCEVTTHSPTEPPPESRTESSVDCGAGQAVRNGRCENCPPFTKPAWDRESCEHCPDGYTVNEQQTECIEEQFGPFSKSQVWVIGALGGLLSVCCGGTALFAYRGWTPWYVRLMDRISPEGAQWIWEHRWYKTCKVCKELKIKHKMADSDNTCQDCLRKVHPETNDRSETNDNRDRSETDENTPPRPPPQDSPPDQPETTGRQDPSSGRFF